MKTPFIDFSGLFTQRMAISKLLGFLIGLMGFLLLPFIWADADLFLRWGILLWYTTLGAIVGIMGIMTRHPAMPSFRFSPCFRGAMIGGWMNFVLVFFAYDVMETLLLSLDLWGMHSPFWFVLEGIIVGACIDIIVTKFFGEGKTITTPLE